MFGLPSWLEIIVWVYLAGLVVNLLTFLTAGYQLSRYGGTPFVENWTDRLSEIVISAAWPLGWIFLLYRLRKDRFGFPYHLVRTALGNQTSIRWFFTENYWHPRWAE